MNPVALKSLVLKTLFAVVYVNCLWLTSSWATPCRVVIAEESSTDSQLFSEDSRPKAFIGPEGSKSKITTRQFHDRGYNVQITQGHQSYQGFANEDLPPLPIDSVQEFVDDIVKALIKQYPRRGWTPEFIEKVGKNLVEYFSSSTIVIIRDPTTNEVLATIRLISSPYLMSETDHENILYYTDLNDSATLKNLLPVEKDFLGAELPRPQLGPLLKGKTDKDQRTSLQSIFEISTFTIQKHKDRADLVALLFKYFLYSSYFPTFTYSGKAEFNHSGSLFSLLVSNPKTSFVYAYGDRVGKIMYSPYDFHTSDEFPSKELMGQTWEVLTAEDGIFRGFRSRYRLDELVGEATQLFFSSPELENQNRPLTMQYHPINGPYNDASAHTRTNRIHGGVSPQVLEYWRIYYEKTGIAPPPNLLESE